MLNELSRCARSQQDFVRSGYITLRDSYLRLANIYGYYWSGLSGSVTSAYRYSFDTTDISPASAHHRYYGISARCLASGA